MTLASDNYVCVKNGEFKPCIHQAFTTCINNTASIITTWYFRMYQLHGWSVKVMPCFHQDWVIINGVCNEVHGG